MNFQSSTSKFIRFFITLIFCLTISSSLAKSQKNNSRKKLMRLNVELSKALNFAKKGNYLEASKKLFHLSQNPRLKNKRIEIRYILGESLHKLGLLHAASFQFVSIVKTGDKKYALKSLGRLSEITSKLGDNQILQFAIQKGGAQKVKGEYRNLLYYQYGKYKMRERNFKGAVFYLKKISPRSLWYDKAKYNLGLVNAEMNRAQAAINHFNTITSRIQDRTNPLWVAATMGKARTYYQAKKWSQASHYYRQIPKDTQAWHDMLFENSWTLLRSGKFRSALSAFHTLHSSYYKDYFQPGSLLLRAIIYMYICRYEEMEKVLKIFQTTYKPIHTELKNILKSPSSINFYSLVLSSLRSSNSSRIPKAIAQRVFREHDFQSSYKYLQELEKERNIIKRFPLSWRVSSVGRYSLRLIDGRERTARTLVDKIVQNHIRSAVSELNHFFKQENYLKYEMLRGKREMLSKKIARKDLGETQIIADKSRDYFVQNGFEFWPYDGEHWLDELGNYHYVGLQACR